MIGRALAGTMTPCAALPAWAQDGAGFPPVRVFHAPYEVLTDDPSCNGTGARLFRAKLRIADITPEIQVSDRCYIDQRHGVELKRIEIPCRDVREKGEAEGDRVSFEAELAICRTDWTYSIDLAPAEIGGVFRDNPVDLSLRLSDDAMFLEKAEGRTARAHLAGPFVNVNCSTGPLASSRIPDFELRFVLSEQDLAACIEASCHAEASATDYDQNIFVYAQCTVPETEVGQ